MSNVVDINKRLVAKKAISLLMKVDTFQANFEARVKANPLKECNDLLQELHKAREREGYLQRIFLDLSLFMSTLNDCDPTRYVPLEELCLRDYVNKCISKARI